MVRHHQPPSPPPHKLIQLVTQSASQPLKKKRLVGHPAPPPPPKQQQPQHNNRKVCQSTTETYRDTSKWVNHSKNIYSCQWVNPRRNQTQKSASQLVTKQAHTTLRATDLGINVKLVLQHLQARQQLVLINQSLKQASPHYLQQNSPPYTRLTCPLKDAPHGKRRLRECKLWLSSARQPIKSFLTPDSCSRVCVCVCEGERKREREWEREGEREWHKYTYWYRVEQISANYNICMHTVSESFEME